MPNPQQNEPSSLVSVSAVAAVKPASPDQLTYFQTMAAGAVSRTMAQTIMHPANTYKTILQLRKKQRLKTKLTPERLLRGADAQFLLSLPHGAFYFAVMDIVTVLLGKAIPFRYNFLSDFVSR